MWWWWNSGSRHLPLTQGPYVPGCVDVMSGFGEEATFARIYYPTSLRRQENNSSKWFKWIPHEKYVEGFAKLVSGYSTLIKMVVWSYGGEPMVPCVWEGAPMLSKKTPVIVFSHGFGGTRFVSATIAAELASFGYFLASIEHRESSASATYYYTNAADRDSDKRSWIPHKRLQLGPEHYPVRNQQLHKRVNEVKKLIDYLENINNGSGENILNSNLDIQLFKDRLDLTKLSLMGHSFGGATALLTMMEDTRPKCSVILDGWMFPLKEEKLNIDKPFLFINTQSFHIESNLTFMNKIIKQAENSTNEVYTLKFTTHESHTDSPHVMGYWLDWFQKKLDPVEGTNISNFLILRFYNRIIGFPETEDISNAEKYLEDKNDIILTGTHLFKNGQQVTVAKY